MAANDKNITILRGHDAIRALADTAFTAQWGTLFERCPDATFFQRIEFVRTWYATYGAQWEAIIVTRRTSPDTLLGLWPLAFDGRACRLVHAGSHQAEYHQWLALPGEDVTFVTAAWQALSGQLAFRALHFKYLPGAAQLQALARIGALRHRMLVRAHARPLAILQPDATRLSLRKRANRSRLNRLRRLGPLYFRRLREPSQFDDVLDELIEHYDQRQHRTSGSAPFRSDPAKRRFYRDLFAAAPDDVCITVSYLGKHPLAAFIGVCTGSTVHLGLLIHSPALAAHSPGKLHLLHLREHLLAEGIRVLDLTPGGDAWKDRFAQTHDAVAEVVLYRSGFWYWLARATGALRAMRRRLARVWGDGGSFR